MKNGFIFNHNKCVACSACNAACVLENGWEIQPRTIYTFNINALPGLPVVNLSMACNHCEIAACMIGCPSNAYTRDNVTGAVIIDEKGCIGCRYCQWNCPYDAPKLNEAKRVINKCDLCISSLNTGKSPACSTGCPTGALEYGDISKIAKGTMPEWIPSKALNPSLRICGNSTGTGPEVFPQSRFSDKQVLKPADKIVLNRDISLVLFSFLSTLSVSFCVTYLTAGATVGLLFPFVLVFVAGMFSLLHLKSPFSAWRALLNIRNSPLSREIVFFIFYTLSILLAMVTGLPSIALVSSIAGLVLLIVIDSVYYFTDGRKSLFMHSGQTFISALLIISFFSDAIFPFIFIAILKLASSIFLSFNSSEELNVKILRFLRLTFLIITIATIVYDNAFDFKIITSLFLAGEFIDRLLFYYDFNPLNISQLTGKKINRNI